MKLKQILLAVLISVFAFSQAKADEGMWLLNMLGKNYKQMKAQGFKLKPEDVYNVNKSSLKDAIVIFGGYCTGEIVSDQGLIFTNHHCGYTSIQQHSSLANDYLKEGFWAKSFSEEIPTPGLYVSILQEISDVTDKITAGVKPNMTESDRQSVIHDNTTKLTNEAKLKYSEADFYNVEIKPFFEGNAYYMLVYLVYNDVRMVGTPPDAIGKFGGDTDNWMWPRHTCDFSVFRVYANKDNKPAEYSKDNVPFTPKHHLPISLKGYKEGDFAMVMGFPGTTVRSSTSYEIKKDMLENGYRAKIRGIRQDKLMEDMEAFDEIRIKYATKFAHSSNYWKKSIEANKSLTSLNIVGEKEKEEQNFIAWYSLNSDRKNEYQNVLPTIKEVCEQSQENSKNYLYLLECLLNGMELTNISNAVVSFLLSDSYTEEELKQTAESFYKDYSKSTDYKASLAMLELYKQDVAPEYWPEYLKNNTPQSAVDSLFASAFTTKEGYDKFMEDPSREKMMADPAIKFFMDNVSVYTSLLQVYRYNKDLLKSARRLYLKGCNEMNSGKLLYPDANFTERLTYGNVQSYSPKDGVHMSYYTTTDGILEKEKPGDYEFDVPKKLKDLILAKDFGRYVDADGTMHTCFLTNNDITGGNSGSPVIDGKGNLIGLAFDGNSESMCSDWIFNTKLQRCINVDIRYVLFIIDKYGNCKRLIDELTFAK
ncbi:MAG: S46 family peptidase [Bacteroidales bacterium]|jgi:hypothetical protein|nr:S46 family peptidase [Bacteroidales bacterium]